MSGIQRLFGNFTSYISGPEPDPEELMKQGWDKEQRLNYSTKSYEQNLTKYNEVKRIYEQAYQLGAKIALNSIAMLMHTFMKFIADTYVIVVRDGESTINEMFVEISRKFFSDIITTYKLAIIELSKTTQTDTSDPKTREKSIAKVHNNLGFLLCYGLVAELNHPRKITHIIVEPNLTDGIGYLETPCKYYNDWNACFNIAVIYRNNADNLSERYNDRKIEYYNESIESSIYFFEHVENFIEQNIKYNDEIMTCFGKLLENVTRCNNWIYHLSTTEDSIRWITHRQTQTKLQQFIEKYKQISSQKTEAAEKKGGKTLSMKYIRTSNKSRNYKKGRRHTKSRKGRSKK